MKEKITEIKEVIKERKYFYLIGYIVGYIASLLGNGVPNLIYLIPIKAWGICMALLMGNAMYYGSQGGLLPHKRFAKFIKYFIVAVIILMIFGWTQKFLLNFGINIRFLI